MFDPEDTIFDTYGDEADPYGFDAIDDFMDGEFW